MAGQNYEINGADHPLTGKNRIAVYGVVHNVADQKDSRESESHKHARAMRGPIVPFDEIESQAKSDRAQSIQQSVKGRQKRIASLKISRNRVHIHQPQQEGYGETAHDKDGPDGGARTDFSLFHARQLDHEWASVFPGRIDAEGFVLRQRAIGLEVFTVSGDPVGRDVALRGFQVQLS